MMGHIRIKAEALQAIGELLDEMDAKLEQERQKPPAALEIPSVVDQARSVSIVEAIERIRTEVTKVFGA